MSGQRETARGKMLARARAVLRGKADTNKAAVFRGFFKDRTGDIFLGVPAPTVRKIAQQFESLPLSSLVALMKSPVHEERSLAHAVLRRRFHRGDAREQGGIFKFYLKNRTGIRSWDGVDDSAPYLVGAYLLDRDKSLLVELTRSGRVWDRRIAIVATWWFIRHGHTATTFRIARLLLRDSEDLIHKATGWMLREAGKRDRPALKRFLAAHCSSMPRTMLRYAIERFSEKERRRYLMGKSSRTQAGAKRAARR